MTREILRRDDPDGRAVVGVPLGGTDLHAWLYEADHASITARYGAASWSLNPNGRGPLYVRLWDRARKRKLVVSRLIAGAPAHTLVAYDDNDRLNLRSSNLTVGSGAGGVRHRRSPVQNSTDGATSAKAARPLKARRAVTRTTDDDGAAIVLISLPCGRKAKLLASDFDRLESTGASSNWYANGVRQSRLYVRTSLPLGSRRSNNVMVARLILPPAAPGLVVRYRDGDRMNLRRDNLEAVEALTRANGREIRR